MTIAGLLTELEGRIGRRAYWTGLAALGLIIALSALVFRINAGALCTMDPATTGGLTYFIALTVAALVVARMDLALVVKRLHDIGLSGYPGLLVVLPLLVAGPVTHFSACRLEIATIHDLPTVVFAVPAVLALAGLIVFAVIVHVALGLCRGRRDLASREVASIGADDDTGRLAAPARDDEAP